MRFLRRIAGFLGFTRDNNGHEVKDDEEEDKIDDNQAQNRPNFQETGAPRKGFGVQVQVPVERPQSGPVIVPCTSGDGGVQVPPTLPLDNFNILYFNSVSWIFLLMFEKLTK